MKLGFFKKLRNSKGVTGADIAVAIGIVTIAMGVVMAVYTNVVNKSKEQVRYSAATRIATQLVENIQSITYDELVYRVDNSFNKVDTKDDNSIFGVKVPVGYSAEVVAPKINENAIDTVRNITINVTYKVSNKTKTITFYSIKNKELLEQTNKPNLSLIDGYNENYYPVKYTGNGYVVTTTSDPDWYNYDEGNYALVFYSAAEKALGDRIPTSTVTTGDLYIWVPRFGNDNNSKLAFCYGASNYKITFSLFDNKLYGYMLTGSGNNGEFTIDSVLYKPNTFMENDGLTGIWYKLNGQNTQVEESAYKELRTAIEKNNF